MAIRELNENDIDEVISSRETTIIDFWAEWCAPCKAIAPILEGLASKYEGSINMAKLNISNNMSVAAEHKISSIPCLVVFRNGKELERKVGYRGKDDLEELFSKYTQGS